MNNGWIKLHRKIRENEIWEKDPFDKRSAWIDLLLRATHKPHSILVKDQRINLEPGQLFISQVSLSKAWGWSRHKVANFLNILAGKNKNKMNQMLTISEPIRKNGTSKRTYLGIIISITNWELYQSSNSEEDIKKDINGTSKGHQRDINKNVKNDKNDKNKPNTCVAGNSSATREVFDYWISKLGHTKAKFTRDRKGKISARLKEGFSINELKRAIDGCAASSYHMGDNDDGKVYDSINLIFRNAEKIESFWDYIKTKEQNYDKLKAKYSNR